jgi:hypothetical protein
MALDDEKVLLFQPFWPASPDSTARGQSTTRDDPEKRKARGEK